MNPVLLIIYKRADTTRKVIEVLRKVKPEKLFVAADGPKSDIEFTACQLARSVINEIDWKCDVKKNYRHTNLGCKIGVSSAINWFFENVEQGIILEDDTVPALSFFNFCDELLEYYKNDARVMHIGGSNFQNGIKRGSASYYFSMYPHIWGWATWKKSWQCYDVNLDSFSYHALDRVVKHYGISLQEKQYWSNNFDKVKSGQVDTWDFQWLWSCWNQRGISIIPNVNLVSNIGFSRDATHTVNERDSNAKLPIREIEAITFSKEPHLNRKGDQLTFDRLFANKITWKHRLRRILSI